jgi:AcrR family transcriptional regulator
VRCGGAPDDACDDKETQGQLSRLDHASSITVLHTSGKRNITVLQKSRSKPFDARAAVIRVRDAIVAGKLGQEDLSARVVAKHLGLTTSVFYHHYGSFELFLYKVSVAGLELVADRLEPCVRARSPLLRIAEVYIDIALRQPVLFDLMMVRAYPWQEIQSRGMLDVTDGLRAWNLLITALRVEGSKVPLEDARLFHSAIHGMATLTRGGRMNIDDLEHTDEEVAHRTAQRLVRVFRSWLSKREAG